MKLLPAAWSDGEVRGLRARGGFELAIRWRGGALNRAAVRAYTGGRCRLRSTTPIRVTSKGEAVPVTQPESDVVEFATQPDQVYDVIQKKSPQP